MPFGSYQTSGYVVLRDLFSTDEVQKLSEAAARVEKNADVIHADNLRCRWQNHFESGAAILEAVDPVSDLEDAFAHIAHHPLLMAALRSALGEEACLFKDKLILKHSGSIGQAWHQDFIAWPNFPKSFTTALIAIDEGNAQNGCLEVFEGSQAKGPLSKNDGDYHDLSESFFAPESRVRLELNPGDVALFGAYLAHGSGPNRTALPRRHLYFSYNAKSDGGDQRQAHYTYFRNWMSQRYAEYGCHNFFYK